MSVHRAWRSAETACLFGSAVGAAISAPHSLPREATTCLGSDPPPHSPERTRWHGNPLPLRVSNPQASFLHQLSSSTSRSCIILQLTEHICIHDIIKPKSLWTARDISPDGIGDIFCNPQLRGLGRKRTKREKPHPNSLASEEFYSCQQPLCRPGKLFANSSLPRPLNLLLVTH